MSDPSANCIFCKIVAGQIPASFVYRDAQVSAFLDLHPINPGHLLVIPNRHSEFISEMNDVEAAAVFVAARKIVAALKSPTISGSASAPASGSPSELKCEAANLVLSDGKVSGQEVGHCHLHIIPRFIGDGQRLGFKHSGPRTRAELDQAARLIATRLGAT